MGRAGILLETCSKSVRRSRLCILYCASHLFRISITSHRLELYLSDKNKGQRGGTPAIDESEAEVDLVHRTFRLRQVHARCAAGGCASREGIQDLPTGW